MLKFRLDEILKERNISRYKFSRSTGISEPTIGRMCNNYSMRPDLRVIETVMEALEIEDIGVLFTYEKNSNK